MARGNEKKRILLVEDDADLRRGMHILLSRSYEVRSVEDGISAMTAARQMTPDAVLLDLGLADGDGARVLDWMKEVPSLADVPLIVVTGRDVVATRESLRDRKVERVFAKPADIEEIMAAIEAATAVDRPRPDRKRVLIVDDDELLRRSLSIQLRTRGHVTTAAPDAATALMLAVRERPDVILLDLQLPCGGGVNMLRRVREHAALKTIPVIVMSGRDLRAERDSLFAAGADALCCKPFVTDELAATIEEVC